MRGGGGVPGRDSALGEQPHAGGRGVDDADALGLKVGNEVAERGVVELGRELDVKALQQVDVVDAETDAAFVERAGDALCGEVELAFAVLVDLGGENLAVARHIL